MSIIAQIRSAWNTRRNVFYEAFLVLVVIVFAGWLRCFCYVHDSTIGRDATQYLHQVENWPNNVYTLPLYQGVLFRLTQLGIPAHSAALWLGMICGTLLPVAIYFLVRELADSRFTAFLAALLTAANPCLVKLSFGMIRDMPFWLLTAIGWWLSAIAFKRRGRFAAAAAGFCFGMTAWLRYESVEAILITLAAACLFVPKAPSKWRDIRRTVGCSFCGFVCAMPFAMIVCGLPLDFYFLFVRTFYYRFF